MKFKRNTGNDARTEYNGSSSTVRLCYVCVSPSNTATCVPPQIQLCVCSLQILLHVYPPQILTCVFPSNTATCVFPLLYLYVEDIETEMVNASYMWTS